MEEANTTTDKAAIKDAMAAINFSGVTGSFTLDATGTPQKTVFAHLIWKLKGKKTI